MVMNGLALPRKSTASIYQKVFDARKRRIRGLWQRNGRFFANLTVADDLGHKTSQWVPLAGASVAEAKADYDRLRVERADDRLRPLGLTPTLRDYIQDTYQQQLAASGKRASSIEKEQSYLRRWSTQIGHLRLNKLRAHHLNRFLTELANERYSGRSINLFLIAIRSVLKAALRDAHIKPPLPFEGLTWHRVDTKSRQLFTAAEIDQLCDVARQVSKNGQAFTDYLRLMQYSGARRSEALRIRWRDVNFQNGHVTIGAEGDAKNRKPRHVDFNSQLKALLTEMKERRQPDSEWLFPSPQRGDKDVPTKTFMESLRLARKAAGIVCLDCGKATATTTDQRCSQCQSERLEPRARLLPPKLQAFAFHDLRHHFISYAVMSGVDFMTVANWCGHQDGGVLIGKVYGHLAEGHKKLQAARLTFGVAPVPGPSA
jgi:integrase